MFDPDCRLCPRLASFLDTVKLDHPDYHAGPVAAFGAEQAQLLVVGLAPGMHGANASGRPFTGDDSGLLLYQTLYELGFSNKPVSESTNDDLKLLNCRITNAVKCLPPQNKPTTDEVKTCGRFLKHEIDELNPGAVVLALGAIAHNAILRTLGLKMGQYKFGHLHEYALPDGLWLLDSYHCSRYNTQTKRLTGAMFQQVFVRARKLMTGPVAA
ncbi:MAG TPA: uracil-DNA glycosylase [Candidatus Tenderia electrophaga]|uniref:Type-5 uracil-DNA glycosylase n=1 Tax=Candidatus Tenderia electrophaga TaxID=1748243 RepID=A0A832N6L5_9GAMM|nr:uracil-DNA glycosylase [Candidatus Tenderia electrophaga]